LTQIKDKQKNQPLKQLDNPVRVAYIYTKILAPRYLHEPLGYV